MNKILQLVAILFTAVAMAGGWAHLLELPNKKRLSRVDYPTVQQIYRGWELLGIGQTINLPPAAAGKFVLFVAHLSGERIASDITDRPYLYGLTFSSDRKRILLHNQASTMRGQGESSNQCCS